VNIDSSVVNTDANVVIATAPSIAPTAAPEIDPTSAASGLALLLGGLAVLRGRKDTSISA
jgi:hypothetical protein